MTSSCSTGPPARDLRALDGEQTRALSGMANVAALTFLVARAVPLGWTVGVAGGVPLARAAQREGIGAGYATAAASLVETMAIMGPARMGIPVPHAASAPLLGMLERRGATLVGLAAAGAAVRTGYYVLTSAFSIVVLIGLDAYLGTYERVRSWLEFLPAGRAAALWLTFASLVVWSLAAGLIQAWVIRRGLRRWRSEMREAAGDGEAAAADMPSAVHPPPSRHPGLLVAAAVVGFAACLATTEPRMLGAIALVLAVGWARTAADGRAFLRGLALAAPLAVSTFAFGVVGGIGVSLAARRATRVALLVLIAVWMRSAAGSEGLRTVSIRLVRMLRRIPVLAATGAVLGASAAAADFGGATAQAVVGPTLDARGPENHRRPAAERGRPDDDARCPGRRGDGADLPAPPRLTALPGAPGRGVIRFASGPRRRGDLLPTKLHRALPVATGAHHAHLRRSRPRGLPGARIRPRDPSAGLAAPGRVAPLRAAAGPGTAVGADHG